MSYELISKLETATTKIVQHATQQPYDIFSININLPTREPGASEPSIGNGYNGLDDMKILPLWKQFGSSSGNKVIRPGRSVLVLRECQDEYNTNQYYSTYYEIKKDSYIEICRQ